MGGLLAELERNSIGRPLDNYSSLEELSVYLSTLVDCGISKSTAWNYEKIATIDEETLNAYIESIKSDPSKELTSAGVMRLVPRPETGSSPVEWDIHDAVNYLIDKVSAIAARWPEGKERILAEKLIDLGQELLANGEIAS